MRGLPTPSVVVYAVQILGQVWYVSFLDTDFWGGHLMLQSAVLVEPIIYLLQLHKLLQLVDLSYGHQPRIMSFS
jgi:hypothetical protein